MNKFATIKAELEKDGNAYEDDEAFQTAVDAFMAANDINLAAAAASNPNNKGFSKEKKNAKIKMSKNAANLAGRAFVTLNLQEETSISEKLLINRTSYIKESDSEAAKLAQAGHDLMVKYIDLLTGYVTLPKLVLLQTDIDNFKNCQGTSEMEHEVSPALTKKFEDSFAPVETCIGNLVLLGRDYEESNNEFFTRFMASTAEPTINIHHTYISIHCVGKDSGNPIPNIVFTLEKSKKTATSDWQGIALIERPIAGKDTLTGTLNGKVIYVGHIVILRGKTNPLILTIAEM